MLRPVLDIQIGFPVVNNNNNCPGCCMCQGNSPVLVYRFEGNY